MVVFAPRFRNYPDFDLITLNSIFDCKASQETLSILDFKAHNKTLTCVFWYKVCLNWMCMCSFLMKWGRNIPFLSNTIPASIPKPISIVFAINADCSVVAYTSNPNFEFMPPDGNLARVSKINTTTFEKSNKFLPKQGLIYLVPHTLA